MIAPRVALRGFLIEKSFHLIYTGFSGSGSCIRKVQLLLWGSPGLDNILKKRLALIKARANRLQRLHMSEQPGSEQATGGEIGRESGDREHPLTVSRINGTAGMGTADPGTTGIGDGRLILGDTRLYRRFEELVRGEEREITGSRFFLVRLEGSDVDERAKEESLQFLSRVRNDNNTISPARNRAGPDPLKDPKDQVCFFDIETTGLSPSTYVFLCGMMFIEDGDFVIEQAFARDYEEEEGVLRYIRERLEKFRSVVTYNGKTFDIPFIRARMAVNKLDFEETFSHVDLLGSARRVYSGLLENCRLETVERHLRGEDRVGDIPGGQIPAVYHAFVRTGDASVMERVLYHNRMDLFTMAILYNRLWSGRM